MRIATFLPMMPAMFLCGLTAVKGSEPMRFEFRACVDSWDSDPEPDGWIVRMRLTRGGQHWERAMVARFTLAPVVPTATQTGFRRSTANPVQWTFQVRPGDYADGWIEILLPLRTSRRSLGEEGAVMGRLSARVSLTGVGVYETVTAVPLGPSRLVDTNAPDG